MRAWRSASRSSSYLKLVNKRSYSASNPTPTQRHRSVADILQHGEDGKILSATGWVRSVRKQKRVSFAAISDGSTVDTLQAVLKPEDAATLSHGAAVKLTGEWKASQGSKQKQELQVSDLKILGDNDAEKNPLQPKYQTEEYLRSIPHLRSRIPNNTLVLRLRSQLIGSLTSFFNEQGYIQCHTPIITSSDCEGAGEVFAVSSNVPAETQKRERTAKVEHFFRTPKYLTVSAQLHLEALAQAVDRVWTLSPTFRAEQSDTPRHLSEFYMLEAEMCFTDDLSRVMDLVENMLRSGVMTIQKTQLYTDLLNSKTRLTPAKAGEVEGGDTTHEMLAQRWDGIVASSWPRITYTEAVTILEHAHANARDDKLFRIAPSYEGGLQAEHERYIAEYVGKGKPIFVTDYPRVQKAFYMSPSTSSVNSHGTMDTAACFDLLVPGLCELAGGSLREHRLPELQDFMREKGVDGSGLEWYQDLRKYGSVPHGGFGLGFDRLMCYLSGINNVRDVVAFPRWYGRGDC